MRIRSGNRGVRRSGVTALLVVVLLLAAAACSKPGFVGPLTTTGDPFALLCGPKTTTAVEQLRPIRLTAAEIVPPLGAAEKQRTGDGGFCSYPVGDGSVRLELSESPTEADAVSRYEVLRGTKSPDRTLDVTGLADRAELFRDGSTIVRRKNRVLLVDLVRRPW